MAQVQIISGVERRRQWSKEEKEALVAAAFEPGARVAEVARRADLRPGQIYRWRLQLQAERAGFTEVVVAPTPEVMSLDRQSAAIEATLANGVRLRIPSLVPPSLAVAVIQALVRP